MLLSTECRFSNQSYYTGSKKSIFLAGPTERNSKLGTSWRYEVRKIFNDLPNLVLLIPEPADLSDNLDMDIRPFWPDFNTQVGWELRHLVTSDLILFWVDRNLAEKNYGLTTNVEFGYWISQDSAKVLYGRPKSADSIKYLDYLYLAITGEEPHTSLESLCLSAKEKLGV